MAPREFNADDRAKERESAKVIIGGAEYKPARRTTALMRDFRKLTRQDGDAVQALKRLDEDADDYGEKAAELDEGRERLVYEMVALLLTPSNGNEPPNSELLANELDIEDAGDLLEFLTPGEQKDPTPAETEATSS